jgi:uncharacterized protein YbcV (DUF1398 family)
MRKLMGSIYGDKNRVRRYHGNQVAFRETYSSLWEIGIVAWDGEIDTGKRLVKTTYTFVTLGF